MIYVSFNNENKFMSQEGKMKDFEAGVSKFKVRVENIFSRLKVAQTGTEKFRAASCATSAEAAELRAPCYFLW